MTSQKQLGPLASASRKSLMQPRVIMITSFDTATADSCFNNAVGVSDPGIIPDNQMTASSQYSYNYHPYYSRLHGNRGDGWCARSSLSSTQDWLQVDLGKTTEICGVATQGDVDGDEWTTDFKLSYYSSNGSGWTYYLSEMVRVKTSPRNRAVHELISYPLSR